MSERRRKPRASVNWAASVELGKPPVARRAFLIDLSESGAYLRTRHEVREGDEVRVVFEAGTEHSPAATGRIARIDETGGVGVAFSEANDDLRAFVRRLLELARQLQEHTPRT